MSSSSWSRSADFDEQDEINAGDFVFVNEGTINASVRQGSIPANAEEFASSFINRFEEGIEKTIANYKREDSINKKRQELETGLKFFDANKDSFLHLYELWFRLFSVKSMFAKKLNGI